MCLLCSLLLLLGLLDLAFLLVGFTRGFLGLGQLFCLAGFFGLGFLGVGSGCGGALFSGLGLCILLSLVLGGGFGFSLFALLLGLGGLGPGSRCLSLGFLAFRGLAGFFGLSSCFRAFLGVGTLGRQAGLFGLAGSFDGCGPLTGSFLGRLFAGQGLAGGRFAGLGFPSN